MNVAPDQTIILGLQIFLDHRSLSSISTNQQILMTRLVLIMRYVEFPRVTGVQLALQHSCCLCCCCSNLAIARLPLDCTVGLQIKKLFILPSLSSSSSWSQQVQFSGHSRTLWSFPILITRSKNWSTAGYRRAKWALRWFETVRHFSLQPPELGKVYCTLCCELLTRQGGIVLLSGKLLPTHQLCLVPFHAMCWNSILI